MRNTLFLSVILLITVSLVISCGKKDKDMTEMAVEEAPAAETMSDSEEMTEMVAMPGADAGELWTFITETSPYKDWSFWPGYEGYQPGNQPHGKVLRVFVDDHGISNLADGMKSSMDNGVVVVKENYMADTTLAAITVMYKVEGFNPEVGDWFWAKYGPDGTVAASGTPAGCIGCHGSKASNDYLFTGNVGSDDMGEGEGEDHDDEDEHEHDEDGD